MRKNCSVFNTKEMENCNHEYVAGHIGTQYTYPPKYIAVCICTKCGQGVVFSDIEQEEIKQFKLNKEKYNETFDKFQINEE